MALILMEPLVLSLPCLLPERAPEGVPMGDLSWEEVLVS